MGRIFNYCVDPLELTLNHRTLPLGGRAGRIA